MFIYPKKKNKKKRDYLFSQKLKWLVVNGKSMLHGRDVIQREARWRVGNGKSIQIWNHQWLPKNHSSMISSPIVESMCDATVDILIDDETRNWNNDMLDGLFVPSEADVMRNIPLARVVSKDTLYWPLTHDGRYTCKSEYRFLKEESEPANLCNFLPQETQLWKGLWSMKIPNKVKNLVWRACRNSLPTKENLVRRTIITSSTCDRCFKASESPLHAIWSCPKLDPVWADLDLWGF